MTQEEKSKAYDEALERARRIKNGEGDWRYSDLIEIGPALTEIFPQLRESDSEMIRKAIMVYLDWLTGFPDYAPKGDFSIRDMLYYLEKQKELMPPVNVDPCDASWDAYYQRGLNKGYELGLDAGRKEQKPNSTEDMPYVADEHFFEREPADSFKYKLAEYMTKNCKKGEGPYGYSYNISSESILQMAKEELTKRGELKEQKPAWSEEDETRLTNILIMLQEYVIHHYSKDDVNKSVDWLKALPERFNLQPKPEWSEEDKQWLSEVYFAIDHSMYSEDERQAMKKYIDSLRSQSKPAEWSEEDEMIRNAILGFLNPDKGGTKYSSNAELVEWSNWLKSLRPNKQD